MARVFGTNESRVEARRALGAHRADRRWKTTFAGGLAQTRKYVLALDVKGGDLTLRDSAGSAHALAA